MKLLKLFINEILLDLSKHHYRGDFPVSTSVNFTIFSLNFP